jgi:hypothetical protein
MPAARGSKPNWLTAGSPLARLVQEERETKTAACPVREIGLTGRRRYVPMRTEISKILTSFT